jgi:hypothetical protein
LSFSFDTSAFLDAWVRNYPRDVFPKFWLLLEEAVDDGVVRSSEEVFRELKRRDDEVLAWAKARPHLFLPLDEPTQAAAAEVLERCQELVKSGGSRSAADPFVIALAKVQNWTVVSGERPSGRLDRPHIPDVCGVFGIRCLTLLQFLREQRWRF